MSLRVWLPLNGTLDNQGLDDVVVTNNGATIDNSGKIGKCYSFNGTSSFLNLSPTLMTNFTECSICFWLKINAWNSSYETYFQAGKNGYRWADYIFGILRNGSNSTICFTIGDGSSASNNSYITSARTVGEWCHMSFIYSPEKCKIYLDGILDKEYTTTFVPNFAKITEITIGHSNGSGYQTNCLMNDFRIYDHALSPLEVKQISQGLILHYPLSDNSIQSLDNCYVYPRFETSNSSGGWSHWGDSGHAGTYGQTTDINYIFRKGQTYAHWVANGSSATKNYLLYQSPAFDGGLRSLIAICKEENSEPITNDICYATWNARNGGVENNSWTSIQSLGNGFYLCKCEGISQSGSNDLVGIYIKPGYKVYFSEVYLENYKSVCSDIFFSSMVVYDTSGFCNNGTISGALTISDDTPKYSVSTELTGTFYGTHQYLFLNDSYQKELTVSCWIKRTSSENTSRYISNSWVALYLYSDFAPRISWRNSTGTSDIKNTWAPGGAIPINTWTHICFTIKDGIVKYYKNGIHVSTSDRTQYGTLIHGSLSNGFGGESLTSNNWIGGLSDFRFYCTALSTEDILALYKNSVYIDNEGNLYGTELREV